MGPGALGSMVWSILASPATPLATGPCVEGGSIWALSSVEARPRTAWEAASPIVSPVFLIMPITPWLLAGAGASLGVSEAGTGSTAGVLIVVVDGVVDELRKL